MIESYFVTDGICYCRNKDGEVGEKCKYCSGLIKEKKKEVKKKK